MESSTVDACVQQWAVDLSEMKDLVPEKWQKRLTVKSKLQDPISGTLMPTIPWHHAYWNEDSPDAEPGEDGAYTDSGTFQSPEKLDDELASRGVETAILTSHEMRFLPSLPSPQYSAALASSYNRLIARDWLPTSDRLKGSIVVPTSNPEAGAEEIRTHGDDPDMVTGLLYGGGELPLGHRSYEPVYEAAADVGLPLTVYVSGNPIHRQTAMGIPEHYVTHDTNLGHNHMTNLVNVVFQGVFDRYPDLDIVWAGQGASWILQTLWRSTRYYRNLKETAPVELEREPIGYLDSNCYVTTYPLGDLPDETTTGLFDMVGYDRILYGSGYPYWNADTVEDLPEMDDEQRTQILSENARRVFGL